MPETPETCDACRQPDDRPLRQCPACHGVLCHHCFPPDLGQCSDCAPEDDLALGDAYLEAQSDRCDGDDWPEDDSWGGERDEYPEDRT